MIKFMGQYGRSPLATAGLLVLFYIVNLCHVSNSPMLHYCFMDTCMCRTISMSMVQICKTDSVNNERNNMN